MKQKSRRGLITGLSIGIVILLVLIGGMLWFLNSHVFIDGKALARDAEVLNLRGQNLSVEEYETIRSHFPDAEILWSVPFQKDRYPDDTTSLTVTTLAEADLDALAHFPRLQRIEAAGCRDYELLKLLRQRYPQLQVSYTVAIDGQEYPQDAVSLTVSALTDEDIAMIAHLQDLERVDASACRDYEHLSSLRQIHPELEVLYEVEVLGKTLTQADTTVSFDNPDVSALMTELAWAVDLQSVHMESPSGDAASLVALTEHYPNIAFTWNKTALGRTISSEETEIDLSGMSLGNTDEVEQALAFFPKVEKVIMSGCGFDNETMAAFRDKMRPEYKVVWTVYVTKKPIRTDATVIHSSALGVCLIDEQSYDLKYCEDAVVVDIGHSYVKYIEWVRDMPNLKYLILADNWIKDLSPISDCKKLEYLELFDNKHIPDYSPLQGCTALKDLNISGTYADPEPLMEMTWLENLWACQAGLNAAERRALQEALPDTHMEFDASYTGKGWRELQAYFDMRDLMGLDYNAW